MQGLKFSCSNHRGPCCETGEEALSRVGIDLEPVATPQAAGAKKGSSKSPGGEQASQPLLDHFSSLSKPSFSRAIAAECAILAASYVLTLRSLGKVDS
eukprot:scaffold1187_cov258-Pinguiococcus_pyrenoidosus.AAC.25